MTRRLLLAVTALFCVSAFAQTSVTPILQPRQFFPNSVGAPCSGCSLYSYAAGTTTPQATYTDYSGTVQNPNPVTLDAAGSAQIWMGNKSYKFILKDALGNTIWTVDNVQQSAPYVTAGGGQIGVTGYLPLGTISAKSSTCGAKGDGTTDDTAALNTCFSYAIAHKLSVYLPTGQYKVTQSLNATGGDGLQIKGDGYNRSVIVHALTEAYPVLDLGGTSNAVLEDFGIEPSGGTLSNSQATAGILVSNGSGGTTAGGGTRLVRVEVDAAHAATACNVALINTDLNVIQDSKIGTGTGSGEGAGITAGGNLGKCTGLASKFYTLTTGANPTKLTFANNAVNADLAPAYDLTGSGVYVFQGNEYGALVGSGAAGEVIDIDSGGGVFGNALRGHIRTENQSSAAGMAAINLEASNRSIGSDLDCDCNANSGTDTTGVMIKGPSTANIWNGRIFLYGAAGSVWNFAGSVYNLATLGAFSASSWGSLTGTNTGGLRIVTDIAVPGTLLDTIKSQTGALRTVTVCATTFYCINSNFFMHPAGGTMISSDTTSNLTENIFSGYYNGSAGYDVIQHNPTTGNFYFSQNNGAQKLILFGPTQSWSAGSGGFDYYDGTHNFGYATSTGNEVHPNGDTISTSQHYCLSDGTHCPASSVRAGSWTVSASTSAPVTFGPPFSSTPSGCGLTTTGTTATLGAPWISGLSSTGFTVNITNSGTISGYYVCSQ